MERFSPGACFAGHKMAEPIGRGGMGVVYRAIDVELEREVALKVIAGHLVDDPEFRERFKRESRLAARIRHPHAITVYRAGEDEGALFVTMPLIEGASLGQLLETEGSLDPERAVHIVAQVAEALDAAHELGLVHRDVKPENVLIERRGAREHAYLTDFGLARKVSSGSHLTQTGHFVGTLHYAAPEQVRGERVDARADVYALGCMLYHALTGQVPYPRDTPQAVLLAQVLDEFPRPSAKVPGLPAQFDRVVERATFKEASDRYPSAGDLGRAALAASSSSSVTAPEGSVARGDAALGSTPSGQPRTDGAADATSHRASLPVHAASPAPERPLPPPPPSRKPTLPTPLPNDATPEAASEVSSSRRPRRRAATAMIALGVLVLGAGLATAVLIGSPANKDKGTTTSTPAPTSAPSQSTTAQPPRVVAQINLTGSGKAKGVAQVLVQAGTRALAIIGQGLEPTSDKEAYGVWLYKLGSAKRLGFAPPVDNDGRLEAVTPLPANASKFRELIVTRETEETMSDMTPGPIVLRGPLQLQ